MGKVKYTEEEFIKEVNSLYNSEVEVVGRYKGLNQHILAQDKYGVIKFGNASQLLNFGPNIKAALNKTEYFMNQLREAYPEIAEQIEPASEYERAKTKMLFNTKYGLVSISPDALIHGHCPNIRSAVDRKEYFRQQLVQLYDSKYDFEVTSTSRHEGRVTLICPIHGPQSIDTDSAFLGHGCPECNHGWEKSDTLYIIRLFNHEESFYKLGISYKKENGEVRRYDDYYQLGYQIEEIKVITYEDFLQAREVETRLKRIIKDCLYAPKHWEHSSSTECFTNNLIPTLINNLDYDIVSTSDESQSSCLDNGSELTNPNEDI